MTMTNSLAQEILAILKTAKPMYLVLHRAPDADSLGAAAAFGAILEYHNIPYQYYCSTKLSEIAQFFGIDSANCLDASGFARLTRQNLTPVDGNLGGFGVVCTFDAGDLEHSGLTGIRESVKLKRSLQFDTTPFLIVFDHHATNTRFGNLNVIDTSCASTTELIYQLIRALGVPIEARIASYLLAGILTDTDHFFNPATSASALSIAGELMTKGVSLSELRSILFERRGLHALRLIGEVLARLKKHQQFDIAYTYLTEADIARHETQWDELDGLANILNVVGDAKATLVLKEEGGCIKGSFRTTRDDTDLGRLAEMLGGGGHRKAAGFRMKGALQIEEGRVRIL